MACYYVYVLQEALTKRFYIGFSHNLRQRVHDHKIGKTKTTRGEKYSLIYFEGYLDKKDALGREKFLKGGSGHKYLAKQLRHFLGK
jgi:putative endonuclease